MTIRITLVLCQYAKLRNADYVQHQIESDEAKEVSIENDMDDVMNTAERKATLDQDEFRSQTEQDWFASHKNSLIDRSIP